MSFPNQCPKPVVDIPQMLFDDLSSKPVKVLKNRLVYFAIMVSEEDVRAIKYQRESLKLLALFDVVVTA